VRPSWKDKKRLQQLMRKVFGTRTYRIEKRQRPDRHVNDRAAQV
jgi:hypothetical protein